MGLGFPYEGPAPLEAIANGCFFINPKVSEGSVGVINHILLLFINSLLLLPLTGFWYFSSVCSFTILDKRNCSIDLAVFFFQFIPPKSRLNAKFFRDKPTLRLVRKQALFFYFPSARIRWNWIGETHFRPSSTHSSQHQNLIYVNWMHVTKACPSYLCFN